MFILEIYTTAISSHELCRAEEIAAVMTPENKDVAREIWNLWVSAPAPF